MGQPQTGTLWSPYQRFHPNSAWARVGSGLPTRGQARARAIAHRDEHCQGRGDILALPDGPRPAIGADFRRTGP